MSGTNKKLRLAVETYFADLKQIRASGGATGEMSFHTPLVNLLNAVGATLAQLPRPAQRTMVRGLGKQIEPPTFAAYVPFPQYRTFVLQRTPHVTSSGVNVPKLPIAAVQRTFIHLELAGASFLCLIDIKRCSQLKCTTFHTLLGNCNLVTIEIRKSASTLLVGLIWFNEWRKC